jgi:hypothetical protein
VDIHRWLGGVGILVEVQAGSDEETGGGAGLVGGWRVCFGAAALPAAGVGRRFYLGVQVGWGGT